jgi:hypothetical protein
VVVDERRSETRSTNAGPIFISVASKLIKKRKLNRRFFKRRSPLKGQFQYASDDGTYQMAIS